MLRLAKVCYKIRKTVIILDMQYLILIAVVIGGILWLIYKIFEGLSFFFSNISKSFENHKKEEEGKKKKDLEPFIRYIIPDELNFIEKKIQQVGKILTVEANKKNNITPPYWTEISFNPYEKSDKSYRSGQMLVTDTEEILSPNNLKWTDVESEQLKKKCEYPAKPPVESVVQKQGEIGIIPVDLKEAIFDYDKEKVYQAEIERYFGDEIKKVTQYNEHRAILLNKVEFLNDDIKTFNIGLKKQETKLKTENHSLYEKELLKFSEFSKTYEIQCKKQKENFLRIFEGYKKADKDSVIERLDYILSSLTLPKSIPHTWDVDFNSEEKIAIVEIGLPDVVHKPPLKIVKLKSGNVRKELNQAEKREVVPNIHPAILLRVAHEIFRNDSFNVIKLLVLNGWVKFDDPKTGKETKAYTASLMVQKEQVGDINLEKIDPLVAFIDLKGKSAGKLIEVIPITPVMSLDRKDKRFIATTEVLNKLGSETNLASMDWQDFESLIAELFEKEFAKEGAEVKVTQASRDRGVDAVIFDPDPIKGGKIIVQAKRYANTVDVSAVRDLCAVVKKEGAIKGLLVTTSTFGGDAYKFANNEPVTLLNGAELLGLLKKHGYSFRINLEEAKKLNIANNI